jgi:lysozyme
MSYKISESGIRFLCNEEGCILHPYHGAADLPEITTIYVGHVVKSGEVFDPPYTQEKADATLRSDLSWVEAWMMRHCPWVTDGSTGRQHQYDACCSFIFNEGKIWDDLLALVNSSDPVDPAVLTRKWCEYTKAGGKPGVLKLRRLREVALYLTPDVPEEQIDRSEVLAQVEETSRELMGHLLG